MKRMGLWFRLLLVLLLAIVAAGCGGGQPKEKIVYMTHNGKAVFGSIIQQEFDKIAKKNQHPVEYLDAQGDAARQIEQLEKAVQDGAKCIVLLAVDEEKIVPAAEKAAAAGVRIVAVNRHLRTDKISGVYPDEYGAGKLQAEDMEKNLPAGAHVFYLQGTAVQLSSQKRWEGFRDRCLEKRPDIVLMDSRDGGYSREQGRRITEEWLAAYDQIDAVVCGNDEMALGALAALKEAHRARSCMISGIDATEEALAAIAAGDMRQTIKQDAIRQANGAYQMVSDPNRASERKTILISFLPVTKDNLAQFRK
ncbi:MAG: sugar ABC transporter substrate-binding protein [Schwartzia sp.]|nr:sugar ABC transporter substrate-binding protein [Schwartzia sp. (in: firmicutes)]